MNLYKIPANSSITEPNDDKHEFVFADKKGGAYAIDIKELQSLRYDRDVFHGYSAFEGETFGITIKYGSDYRNTKNNLSEGTMLFSGSKHIQKTLPDLVKENLPFTFNKGNYHFSAWKVAKRVYKEAFIDFENSRAGIVDRTGYKSKTRFEDGNFYAAPYDKPALAKFDDQEFQIEWVVDKLDKQNDIEGSKQATQSEGLNRSLLVYGDTLVTDLTTRRTYRESRTQRHLNPDGSFKAWGSEPFFVDGTVYCLKSADGSEVWQQTFPVQIDDIAKMNDTQLVVASERNLYIVEASTGNITKEIDSGMREGERLEHSAITLLAYGEYLFVFSTKDHTFQVRELATLKLIREIDKKEAGWCFAVRRPRLVAGKIFVPVGSLGWGSLLVIDPDNIDAEFVVEETPEMTITLPTEERPSGITIEIDNDDWAKVVRFLELEAFKSIREMSYDEISKAYSLNLPNFVKKEIHIRYSGYQEDKAFIDDKMLICKQRLYDWLSEPLGYGKWEITYELI